MRPWLWAWAALCALSCRSEPDVVPANPGPADSARPPVDRLAPGELEPGTHSAFGLVLPRGMRLERRFPDAVHAAGNVRPDALLRYVRDRVGVPLVEVAPRRTIFERTALKGQPPDKLYRIEIVEDGLRTRLLVRDVTPPPTVQGLTEQERYRRAGITPDGKLLDANKLQ